MTETVEVCNSFVLFLLSLNYFPVTTEIGTNTFDDTSLSKFSYLLLYTSC